MAVSAAWRAKMLDLLCEQRPVTNRRLFGGVGIYIEGMMFALMDNDRLYFKTDDANRPDYEARGIEAFAPFGDEGQVTSYYEVPDDVLSQPDTLSEWIRKAVEVAERKRRSMRNPRSRSRRTQP